MFVRISLVVHRHLKFLREHSNLPQLSSSPVPERAVTSNSNSLNKESAWLKTPECQYKRQTYDSLATVTSGKRDHLERGTIFNKYPPILLFFRSMNGLCI